MNRADRRRLKETLRDFHEWIEGTETDRCRLVQYRSVDLVAAGDVLPEEIDQWIEKTVIQGQEIQWAIADRCLYFRVWEYPGPEPPWEAVVQERSLVEATEDGPDPADVEDGEWHDDNDAEGADGGDAM